MWCRNNYLSLNAGKTKDIVIIDFQRTNTQPHGDYPDQLHHCVVWELHYLQPQDSAGHNEYPQSIQHCGQLNPSLLHLGEDTGASMRHPPGCQDAGLSPTSPLCTGHCPPPLLITHTPIFSTSHFIYTETIKYYYKNLLLSVLALKSHSICSTFLNTSCCCPIPLYCYCF